MEDWKERLFSLVESGSKEVFSEASAKLLDHASEPEAWGVIVELLEHETVKTGQPLELTKLSHVLTLCKWVLFASQEPKEAEKALRQSPIASGGRCNRVWLNNHVAYRCKDCGTTESSCMCVECFDPQEHIGHDFRLYRSASGGCCDCGDPNAWKPSGYCKRHRRQEGGEDDIVNRLEEKMRRGARIVFKALSYEVALCLFDSIGISEIGTTESVTGVQASEKKFLWMASFDANGQKSITRTETFFSGGREKICRDIIDFLIELAEICPPFRRLLGDMFLVKYSGIDPLTVLIVFGIFAGEELQEQVGVLFLRLLIDEEFKKHYTKAFVASYGYLVDNYLFGPVKVRTCITRFLDRILCQLCNSQDQVSQLVTGRPDDMLSIIIDRILRLAEMNSLPRRFDFVVPSSTLENHPFLLSANHPSDQVTAAALPQNETAMHGQPTVDTMRRQHGSPVQLASNSTSTRGRRYRKMGPDGGFPPRTSSTNRVVDCSAKPIRERLFDRLVMDLRLLLVHNSVVEHAILFRQDIMDNAIRIMCLLQELNLQARKCDQHVLFDSSQDWEAAFILELDLAWAMFRIIDGYSSCVDRVPSMDFKKMVVRQVLLLATQSIVTWLQNQGFTASRFINSSSSNPQDVASTIVASLVHKVSSPSYMTSVHIPLHRFWAGIFRTSLFKVCEKVPLRDVIQTAAFPHLRDTQAPSDVLSALAGPENIPKGFACFVVEHPLRVVVKMGQISCRMWIRNGASVDVEPLQYLSRTWNGAGLDMDLFILQYGATAMEGETFLKLVTKRFELAEYFTYQEDFATDLSMSTLSSSASASSSSSSSSPEVIRDASGWNVLPRSALQQDSMEQSPPSLTATSNSARRQERERREKMSPDQAAYMAEYFFRFLGVLVHDRTSLGETPEQILRKQVVHALAAGPDCKRTFSAIENQVLTNLLEDYRIEPILEQVAVYHAPAKNDAEGYYMLKDHLWFEEVDIYFSHYSNEMQHTAEENYRIIHRRKRKRRETSLDMSHLEDSEIFQGDQSSSSMNDTSRFSTSATVIGGDSFAPASAAAEQAQRMTTTHEHCFFDLIRVRTEKLLFKPLGQLPFQILWNAELHGHIFRVVHACVRDASKESALARTGVLVEALRLFFQAVELAKHLPITQVYDSEISRFLDTSSPKTNPASSFSSLTSGGVAPAPVQPSLRSRSNSWNGTVVWKWPSEDLQTAFSPPNDMRALSSSINHRVDHVQHCIRLPFANPILNACELVPFLYEFDGAHSGNGEQVEQGTQASWAWPSPQGASQQPAKDVAALPFPIRGMCPEAKDDKCVGVSLFMLLLQLSSEKKWGDHVQKLTEEILQNIQRSIHPLVPGVALLQETFRLKRSVSKKGSVQEGRRSRSASAVASSPSSPNGSVSDEIAKPSRKKKSKKKLTARPPGGNIGDGASVGSGSSLATGASTKKNKRQAQIMAEFAKRQAAFLSNFEMDETEGGNGADETQQPKSLEAASGPGAGQTRVRSCSVVTSDSATVECSLCREHDLASKQLGMVAFMALGSLEEVQERQFWVGATELSTAGDTGSVFDSVSAMRGQVHMKLHPDLYPEVARETESASNETTTNKRKKSLALFKGCGHFLHFECLQDYQRSLVSADILNLQDGEYQCPTCRSIGNLLVPLVTVSHEEDVEMEDQMEAEIANPKPRHRNLPVIQSFLEQIVRKISLSSNGRRPATSTSPERQLRLSDLAMILSENFRLLLSHVNSNASKRMTQNHVTFQLLFQAALAYAEEQWGHSTRTAWFMAFQEESLRERVWARRDPMHVFFEACLLHQTDEFAPFLKEFVNRWIGNLLFAVALAHVSESKREEEQNREGDSAKLGEMKFSEECVEECVALILDQDQAVRSPASDSELASALESTLGQLPKDANLKQLVELAVQGVQLATEGESSFSKPVPSCLKRMSSQWFGLDGSTPTNESILDALSPFLQSIASALHCLRLARVTLRGVNDGGLASKGLTPLESFDVAKWIDQTENVSIDVGLIHDSLRSNCLFLQNLASSRIPRASSQARELLRFSIFGNLSSLTAADYPFFVQLPELHTNLYLRFCTTQGEEEWVCRKCSTAITAENSIICLNCGLVLCIKEKCRESNTYGVLSDHASECHCAVVRGVCAFLPACMSTVYLTIDDIRILQYGSIYLDAHGEADPSLHRGKPLYLSSMRLAQLRKLTFGLFYPSDTKGIRRLATAVHQ